MTDAKQKNIDTELGGVWPALITPLDENKNPNYEELKKLIDLQIEEGMDGLYLLGSTGQGVLFSEEQRMEITAKAVEFNNARLPLIVQVGSTTTQSSQRLAEHAASCGATGISAVGPIYYQASANNMGAALKHYRDIAAASDLPFYPYQLGDSGFREGVAGFIKGLMEIPHLAGMKITTDNLVELRTIASITKGDLTLFSGADPLMCHAALSGADGAIGTFYNLWGPECKKIRAAFLNGNVVKAINFMQTFHEVIMHVIPSIWSFIRQGIKYRYGIEVGLPIHPLGNQDNTWSDDEVVELVNRVINSAKIED